MSLGSVCDKFLMSLCSTCDIKKNICWFCLWQGSNVSWFYLWQFVFIFVGSNCDKSNVSWPPLELFTHIYSLAIFGNFIIITLFMLASLNTGIEVIKSYHSCPFLHISSLQLSIHLNPCVLSCLCHVVVSSKSFLLSQIFLSSVICRRLQCLI